MLVPIRIDRTRKPPIGTSLRSDGHWSVQGLVGAWAFNEGAGKTCANVITGLGTAGAFSWVPDGINCIETQLNTLDAVERFFLPKFTYIAKITNNTAPTAPNTIIGFNQISGCPQLRVNAENRLEFLKGNVASLLTGNTVLPLRTSFSVAVTFAGAEIRLYVSGNQDTLYVNNTYSFDYTMWPLSFAGRSGEYAEDVDIEDILVYNYALSSTQVASLSANPWQIYEPEILWVDVGGSGGTAYADSLTTLAESYASITDVATYVDAATALITAGVDATSAITMTEAVLTTAQAADTVADTMQRLESVLSVVQAADTVADAQAMAESLVSEITASVSVADSLNNSSTESLATEIAAASTVQDVVTILEQVHTTLEAQATVVDEQTSGAAENLVTSATAITSATDLQLMVDNVTVMAQSGASIGEIGSYLEQIATAATAGASVTDTIVGALTYYSEYICRLPSEQRICRLPSEQRICRLPSEQRIIAIPSERRICRLTRSSL